MSNLEITSHTESWGEDALRVFVSHVTSNAPWVEDLRGELAPWGIEAFVAHSTIDPSQEWMKAIREALDTCEAFIAVLNDGFRESDWCNQEVGWAVGRGVPIISLRFDYDPYGFAGSYQAMKVTDRRDKREIAAAIYESLFKNEKTRDKLRRSALISTEKLVDRFVSEKKYLKIRESFDDLERAQIWSSELLDRVENAPQKNSNIDSCRILKNEEIQRFVQQERRKLQRTQR